MFFSAADFLVAERERARSSRSVCSSGLLLRVSAVGIVFPKAPAVDWPVEESAVETTCLGVVDAGIPALGSVGGSVPAEPL